jgi:ABC-2 type transport system permease protein
METSGEQRWSLLLARIREQAGQPGGSRWMLYGALGQKAWRDARAHLAVSCTLLVLFAWLFIWLMSLFKAGAWPTLLSLIPDVFKQLIDIPPGDLASLQGRLTFLYVHIVTLLVAMGWAIGRGSDAIGGGIAKGTLELVLTLPVRREAVLAISALINSLGAGAIALSVWLGTALGLATVRVDEAVHLAAFWPGVLNLAALTFFLGGMSTLLSTLDRDRWRPIWISCGLFLVATIVKMVSRLWPGGEWLKYLNFLTPFEPQMLILHHGDRWVLAWRDSGILFALGLTVYLAALVVVARRDIPVPR